MMKDERFLMTQATPLGSKAQACEGLMVANKDPLDFCVNYAQVLGFDWSPFFRSPLRILLG